MNRNAETDRHDRAADPARLAAGRILHAVLESGAYANLSAISQLDDARLDARDRRFASALVYGTLSRSVSIDWLLAKVSNRPMSGLDPWVRTILRLGVWQLYWAHSVPAPAAIDESVRLVRKLAGRRSSGFVNAVLRRLDNERPALPANNPSVLYSLPAELYGHLRKAYGDQEAAELAACFLHGGGDVTARANVLRNSQRELLDILGRSGITAQEGLYCPEAVRIDLQGQPVRNLDAWQEGRLSIQDEAAMLVGHAAHPSAGQTIVDLCAAPGGKTCHLAELTGCLAEIRAFDLNTSRVGLIEDNLQRLGLSNVTCQQGDATGLGIDSALQGTADLVVADVPCSGLGLLAGKPDIRLNMTHERIVSLYPLQAAILDYAASLVKRGGTLIYSTCTINPAENIDRIRTFLQAAGPSFRLDPLTPFLPDRVLKHDDLGESAAQGWIQLLPNRHHVDGFFIARLRRGD